MDAYDTQLARIANTFEAHGIPAEVAHVGGGCMGVAVYADAADFNDAAPEAALAGGMGGYDDPLSFDVFDRDGEHVADCGGYLRHDDGVQQLVEATVLGVVFSALRRAHLAAHNAKMVEALPLLAWKPKEVA